MFKLFKRNKQSNLQQILSEPVDGSNHQTINMTTKSFDNMIVVNKPIGTSLYNTNYYTPCGEGVMRLCDGLIIN